MAAYIKNEHHIYGETYITEEVGKGHRMYMPNPDYSEAEPYWMCRMKRDTFMIYTGKTEAEAIGNLVMGISNSYKDHAVEWSKHGGLLECLICGERQELDEQKITHYIFHGWPDHCGLTMRWLTRIQLDKQAQEGGDNGEVAQPHQ